MAKNTLQSREPYRGSCRWLIGLALVLIVFMGTTSCSKKDDSTDNETASPETSETANASPSPSGGEQTPTPASGGEPNTNQTGGSIPRPSVDSTRPQIPLPAKSAPGFEGNWINVDPKTPTIGFTRLVINQNQNQLSVHAFTKCLEKDCDLGTSRGSAGRNVGRVVFKSGSLTRKLVLTLEGDNKLKIVEQINNFPKRHEYVLNRQP